MKLSSSGALYPTKLPNLGDGTDLTDLNWTQKSSAHVPTAGVLRKSKKPRRYAIGIISCIAQRSRFFINAYAKE